MKIAIVGATGQVGTEIILQLDGRPGVTPIPIARSRSSAAYLLDQGVDVRVGSVDSVESARQVLSDCAVVLNLAYDDNPKASSRRRNLAVQRNLIEATSQETKHVLASTIMVYAPELPIRVPSTYGVEKLLIEEAARRLCTSAGQSLYVFRLGHVLGDLQRITAKIRDEVASPPVPIYLGGEFPSNSVFVTAVTDALATVALKPPDPGTYDLISQPQWSWADVYRHYSAGPAHAGLFKSVPLPPPLAKRAWSSIVKQIVASASQQRVRERLSFGLRFLDDDKNDQLHAWYNARRAAAEIGQLEPPSPSVVEYWRPVGKRPFPGISWVPTSPGFRELDR